MADTYDEHSRVEGRVKPWSAGDACMEHAGNTIPRGLAANIRKIPTTGERWTDGLEQVYIRNVMLPDTSGTVWVAYVPWGDIVHSESQYLTQEQFVQRFPYVGTEIPTPSRQEVPVAGPDSLVDAPEQPTRYGEPNLRVEALRAASVVAAGSRIDEPEDVIISAEHFLAWLEGEQ